MYGKRDVLLVAKVPCTLSYEIAYVLSSCWFMTSVLTLSILRVEVSPFRIDCLTSMCSYVYCSLVTTELLWAPLNQYLEQWHSVQNDAVPSDDSL